MKRSRLLSLAPSFWLAAGLVALGPGAAQSQAQDPAAPATLDVQQVTQGLAAMNAGNYAEAITLFEGIPQQFPTSPLIPEANLRLGYAYFLTGEYDKAIASLEKNAEGKNVPPNILELSAILIPQVTVARASKLPAEDPARKDALADAVKQFDAFVAKFPQSEEVESANLGKARALFQMEEYDDAVKALRANLQAFPQSPSALDTQFMLAAVLGTQGTVAMQKATAQDPVAEAAFKEAEQLLRSIIQRRTDIALVNEAHFQLGELLAARASFVKGPAQLELQEGALEQYRSVLPKELVIKAQQDRLNQIREAIRGSAGDLSRLQRAQRLLQREMEKLTALEARGDQTLAAKLKSAQVFLARGGFDEARLLVRFADQFTEDAEQKKQILYFTTVSYAAQHLVEKAVEHFEKFQTAYPNDPMGENVPLLIGSAFLDPDPKINDPEKAISYFRKQVELYPKSRYAADAAAQEAEALRQLKRYDEALATLNKFISTSPSKELAAAAEFSLGTIHLDTGKPQEAIKAYTAVRDKYAGTPEAERAAFWIGQITLGTGDVKTAQAELTSFLEKFPQSDLAPAAMLYVGQAQAQSGQKEEALKTYEALAEKHPQSEPAPASFFQRASIHQADGELDKVQAVMREFIQKYPESDRLYSAFDYIAQIQVSAKQPLEAIATYEEFIGKHPENASTATAYLKASGLWRAYAESQGPYLTLNEEKRAEWNKGLTNSITAAEQVVEKFPASPEVALALQNLLAVQRLQLKVKLKTDAEVDEYLQGFAKRFEAQPETRSKILFTQAGFAAEKDENRAFELMQSAYDPKLIYAPADLDLYGSALIAKKLYEEAQKVYDKLAADNALPPGGDPSRAPRSTQEAQSLALFGTAKILQEQGKTEEATARLQS
jgi:outer membrane protein assembly factor BamD (BamD/ComL family)